MVTKKVIRPKSGINPNAGKWKKRIRRCNERAQICAAERSAVFRRARRYARKID